MSWKIIQLPILALVAVFLSITASRAAHAWTCPDTPISHSQVLVLKDKITSGEEFHLLGVTRDVSESLVLKLKDTADKEPDFEYSDTWGYIPRALSHKYPALDKGTYMAALIDEDDGRVLACSDIVVSEPGGEQIAKSGDSGKKGVWEIRRDWSPEMEDLFSVFVSKLFYVMPGSKKGWKPLHQATMDPTRNILFGILGFKEDDIDSEEKVAMAPDCADAPYFVRAYFAWKMGLPVMFNECRRGNALTGPRCVRFKSSLTKSFREISNPISRFNAFVKSYIGWRVHAGNPLTLPGEEASDFYPIELTEANIRPGVVFVDGGGHIILVSQWDPQSETAMGVLYGVDAHPDKTVTHKRFGAGTFIFNSNYSTDGFKAFRPVVKGKDGLRFLSNSEVDEDSGYLPYSEEQKRFKSKQAFYDRVLKLLNPRAVDPKEVLIAKIELFYETMLERVEAVQIGAEHMSKTGWAKMPMPQGATIFQTTGPWETYSTPARDLRCFLALDDVMKFPNRVAKNPSLYALDPEADISQLQKELIEFRDQKLMEKRFDYVRSDGSSWTLSLKDIVDRQEQLEMAYNPNDCPETRWAASEGSEEHETCVSKAPPDQLRQMRIARVWFSSRRRPDQR